MFDLLCLPSAIGSELPAVGNHPQLSEFCFSCNTDRCYHMTQYSDVKNANFGILAPGTITALDTSNSCFGNTVTFDLPPRFANPFNKKLLLLLR